MDFWFTLIQFIGAIIALIIIHELGHFFVARLLNVEVEEFGLGFPPRITTLFTAWGTKFTLNAIPFGGFVRPKGENDPTIPGGLAAASPWVRIAVLIAGPLANLILAVILYAAIFTQVGVPDRTKVMVGGVSESSPAETAGMLTGDIVTEVNGEPVNSTDELLEIIYANLGQEIELIYQRGEELTTVRITPRDPPPADGAIGIGLSNPTSQANLLQAIPYGAAATYYHSVTLLRLPVQIVAGQLDPDQGRLVGFKGMFDIYQDAVEEESVPGIPAIVNVIFFFTQITISLGLFNLVPFPALDGGRILFTLPEIIIRRRVPQEYENWINLIGFGLLLMLLIYVNLQDFINPATIP